MFYLGLCISLQIYAFLLQSLSGFNISVRLTLQNELEILLLLFSEAEITRCAIKTQSTFKLPAKDSQNQA